MSSRRGHSKGIQMEGDKAQNFSKSIKKLFKYCKKYQWLIILSAILAILASLFSLVGPSKISEITDIILDGINDEIDIKAIKSIGIFLISLYGLAFIFSYTQGNIMATVSQKICKQLRKEISLKINRVPLSYFDQKTFGDTLSRITNDVDLIGTTLTQSISNLITGSFMFLGSIILMFVTNWIMAITAILSTVAGFFLMTKIIKKSQKYFKEQQASLGKLNGQIEEIYSGHNIVKVYNGEEKAKSEFNELNESLYNSAWKAQFISGLMMPVMGLTGNVSYVVVSIVGAILAINNIITFGVIVAFMIYVRLFTQPLNTLAQAMNTLQSTAAASERVFEFLEEEELIDEKHKSLKFTNIKGNVLFENVNFSYKKDVPVINDFSIEIKEGQKVAIVGPTGAGKTTLVNLLMRFYEVNNGCIKIDGVDTKQYKREEIHKIFGMVLQDTWLFEGSIKDNIKYNHSNITDDEVIKVCKSIGLHHFIKTLPKGYDTILNNKTKVSEGQKQLITIARTIIENAPLLILDEATSSVDTRTEILIQEAMDKLTVGRTSFIIAHRLSTIKNADIILVMKDGDIIESGNHLELINKKGFYYKLYNSQFDKI